MEAEGGRHEATASVDSRGSVVHEYWISCSSLVAVHWATQSTTKRKRTYGEVGRSVGRSAARVGRLSAKDFQGKHHKKTRSPLECARFRRASVACHTSCEPMQPELTAVRACEEEIVALDTPFFPPSSSLYSIKMNLSGSLYRTTYHDRALDLF